MEIIELDHSARLEQYLETHGPVLLDFWALWCAPCRAMLPSIEQLAQEYPTLSIIKIDADRYPTLLVEYQVRGLPTLLVLQHGEIVERITQTLTLPQFRQILAPYMNDRVPILLQQAQHSQDLEQQYELLCQALVLAPLQLEVHEHLLQVLLALSAQQPRYKIELEQHLDRLSPELLRSPTLSRIQSYVRFIDRLPQQQAWLRSAHTLAARGEFEDALLELFALSAATQRSRTELSAVRELIITVLNLMPDRPLANQYRRRLAELSL